MSVACKVSGAGVGLGFGAVSVAFAEVVGVDADDEGAAAEGVADLEDCIGGGGEGWSVRVDVRRLSGSIAVLVAFGLSVGGTPRKRLERRGVRGFPLVGPRVHGGAIVFTI